MKYKRIVVNADDIGMHPAVDEAVLLLAEKKVVRSASVMTLGVAAADTLEELAGLGVDCGLHLDFTSVFASKQLTTAYTIRALIANAWGRRLEMRLIRDAIDRQLDRFEALAGAMPRFIDGHEHVHQFPVIRDALVQAVKTRYPNHEIYLRDTWSRHWRGAKACMIGALGARHLRSLVLHAGARANSDFAGVYNFHSQHDLVDLWSSWLASLPARGGLVMCHPASAAIGDDAIGAARLQEYLFLSGGHWRELMERHQVEVTGWESALTA